MCNTIATSWRWQQRQKQDQGGRSRAAGAGSAAGSGLSGSYLVTALSALPLLALLGFSASQGKGVKGFFKPATHLWVR